MAMTEAEWLACPNPWTMLEYVRESTSERKLRLFACAACRSLWHLLTDARSRQGVEVAELHADKLTTAEQLYEAAIAADAGADDTHGEGADVADTAADLTTGNAWSGAHAAATMDYPAQRPLHANILRDLIGNPFRPVSPDPAWRTPNVVKLAKAIYDERAFDRLPILADALEEAGCTNADILAHCRGAGPHVRGCWVVDMLLGKE
jgi:hypothetical protein